MAVRTVPRKPPNRRVPKRRPRKRSRLFPWRHRRARQRGPIRRFLRRFWYLWLPPALAFLVGAGTLAYLYVTIPLPPERVLQQTTFLFDRDGARMTSLEAEVDRTIIPLDRMPDHLRQAVLAAEDARFYSHPGISPIDIVRAAWADITGGEIRQGASTITQQLVRNVFPEVGLERTFTRKAKEAILALKLERELDKGQILERYLNTVYFGSGAYGVQAASRTYFGKPAGKITLSEAATLAGVIARPEAFSPNRDRGAALVRRNLVLDRMAELGYISPAEAAVAKGTEIETVTFEEGFADSPSAWFIDFTIDELERRFGADKTYGGGLRVRTTIDQRWQRAAIQAIRNNEVTTYCAFPEYLGGPRTCTADMALVAIDPSNGAIRAIASNLDYSADPAERTFDPATFGCAWEGCGRGGAGGTGRQTGSAFKMFTLAAAIEDDVSLRTTFSGRSPVVFDEPPCGSEEDPWDPENFGGSPFGAMDLFGATRSSVNTIFAQLISAIGPEKVVDIAHRLGIKSVIEPYCSITLGAVETNVLEMTSAYATLGNGGVRHDPTALRSVWAAAGDVLYRNTGEGRRVVDENDAWQAIAALKGVMFGTGSAGYFGVEAFGKTGSEDDRSDAWFCGGTTELVSCVWVGRHEAQIPISGITGGTAAAPVWREFMVVAHEDLEAGEFPDPEFTGEILKPEIPLPAPSPSPSPSPKPWEDKEKKEKPKPSPRPSPSPPPPPPPSPPPSPPPMPSPTPSPSPTETPSPFP